MAGYIPPHSLLNRLDLSRFENTPKPLDVSEDRSWDELMEAQTDTREGLNAWLTIVDVALNLHPKIEDVNDQNAVRRLGHALLKQHKEISTHLDELLPKHAGRTGGVKDENEMMEALSLGGEYQENVLMPFASIVTEAALPLQEVLERALETIPEEQLKEIKFREFKSSAVTEEAQTPTEEPTHDNAE